MFIVHHKHGLINIALTSCINKLYDNNNKVVCRLYYPDDSWWDIEDYYWDEILEKLKL
jgi:hypothetical protein